MLNAEYNRDYSFDIDAYLIENYSQMNMSTRRTVCRLVLSEINDDIIQKAIDELVAQQAITEMAWIKPKKSNKK